MTMDCQVTDDVTPVLPSDINPLITLNFHPNNLDGTKDSQQAAADTPEQFDDDDETEATRGEVFLTYEHKEWVEDCVPHPGNIVEPASLAVITTDVTAYKLDSLPKPAIKNGRLSSLQLESVIKAAQRHRVILPNGDRAGFFIGDAAGVGKGRQIAAIITDNFCRGRKRHIWFSVSTDLIIDAQRDLTDMGSYINLIDGCKAIDKGSKLFGLSDSVKTGVVFSTYSTLVSTVLIGPLKAAKRTRLQQLIDWCGGNEFDGCLVFDECHKAKNFTPGVENSGSKVALAVCEIQRALPKARVLYCSATGVTDTKNMAFMERLGLWGLSSPFKDYQSFLEIVQKKGLGLAEMLAMDMKREGMYVSRMLSFSDTQFCVVEYNLTDSQRLVYNMASHIWNELHKALNAAVERCNCTKPVNQVFWSQHQKFFQLLCISMKVDKVVEESLKAIEQGKCVVIGLQNTGEANMENKILRDGPIDDFVSSCREILLNFLNNHFPVEITSQIPELQTNIKLYDPWALQSRALLTQYTMQLELPDSALDVLIDKLGGPSKVSEMTGRRGRIVRYSPKSKPHYEPRHMSCATDQSLNVQERNEFMSGKKLVAIISDAASTGISLHSDKNCQNQRQRVHITLQLPWSADKAVQQLGRSHRSNQVSGPIYKLVTTELGGERRFAASVARRLQSLGALTKGDRRAASVADLSQFNYDTLYGRAALRLMYHNIVMGTVPQAIPLTRLTHGHFTCDDFVEHMKSCLVTMGVITESDLERKIPVSDSDSRNVARFLNRILGLQVVLQNLIFNYFTCCLDVTINIAKREGKFNEGFVDLTGNSIACDGELRTIFKHLTDNSRLVRLIIDRGMPWTIARMRYESLKGDDPISGFYKTRNKMHNRYFYLLLTPKEGTNNCYKIASNRSNGAIAPPLDFRGDLRPNTGVNYQELDADEIRQKYEKITLERAETEWTRMYEDSLVRCNHGDYCNNPNYCQVGMRKHRVNIICGSLLRILPILELTINKNALKFHLTKYESSVKVVRVCTDDGERLIGLQYPDVLIPLAEKEATAMAEEKQSSPFSDMSDTIEPIHPVQPKLFKRACEPPKTILSYFTKIKNAPAADVKADVKDIKPLLSIETIKTEIGGKMTAKTEVVDSKDDDDDDDIICVYEKNTKRKPEMDIKEAIKQPRIS